MKGTITTEGIILNTLPFQDYHQILTVFSKELGMIKLIVKYALRGKGRGSDPLTQAEFVLHQKSSELFQCKEISPIDHFLPIRQSILHLEAACALLHALKTSQFPHKPALKLYELLSIYLKMVPSFDNPHLLAASFRLKILRYEGLIAFNPLETEFQPPIEYPLFDSFEYQTILVLALSRSTVFLERLMLTPTLQKKIEILFETLITA
jgi:DNA repair protein RecO